MSRSQRTSNKNSRSVVLIGADAGWGWRKRAWIEHPFDQNDESFVARMKGSSISFFPRTEHVRFIGFLTNHQRGCGMEGTGTTVDCDFPFINFPSIHTDAHRHHTNCIICDYVISSTMRIFPQSHFLHPFLMRPSTGIEHAISAASIFNFPLLSFSFSHRLQLPFIGAVAE